MRKHRKIFGYTQEYLRKELKLPSASIVSRWENGLDRPNIENLFKLAIIYRTSVDALYIDLKEKIREELQLNFNDKGGSSLVRQHGK